MSTNDFERDFGNLRKEFEESRKGSILGSRLSRPQADSLVPVEQHALDVVVTRLPDVRPASNSRPSRKEAEEMKQELWRIYWDLQMGRLITDAEIALCVHVLEQLDFAQRTILTRYYEIGRYQAGNEFMEKATQRVLSLVLASCLATLESFPKKLAERW